MADTEFVHFLLDQLSSISGLRAKKMFGTYCLFYNDKIVAIISKDYRIFVKTKIETLPLFLAENAEQFSYFAKGKVQKMHYWSIPELAIEESDELIKWIRLGLQAV
ncbi:TfoX/Sxy family protein [Mannheimia bovis]|uniref:TfoX/Sxy family protein n=1 Tax=Mannheimia indoligenes TaxID=3103145 RepID=A0ABU7ZFS0_9PAST|nr:MULTISPECIES: TfoX/Sxy family protein [Mannheimia]QLB17827.1 competence protein [Mannheimia varigena]WHP48110.1 TfoX/Sxy family protein [Mannheimia bovis]